MMSSRWKSKTRSRPTLWLSVVSLALAGLVGLIHYGQPGGGSDTTDGPDDGVTLFVG